MTLLAAAQAAEKAAQRFVQELRNAGQDNYADAYEHDLKLLRRRADLCLRRMVRRAQKAND